jgi:hypothetical protein
MAPHIKFLTNEAGKVEGLAYAGFETFRGSPYTSCARETGQNSRDAASGAGPVRVSFKLLEISRAEVPFANELQHSIQCCLDEPRDVETKQHLKRALAAISVPTIKVLEISDRNTTGLTGPTTDPTSVFTALVKGDGVTNKADVTSAGSFGIGKNAAYAVSDLQTVIYSTCYRDRSTGDTRYAAQGRLRLISHAQGEKKFSAEGYWGNPGFAAIEDKLAAPTWMRRDEIGTSIYSVGFREQHNWGARMALSLVTNFFLAIDRKEIEFSVGDAVHMNQSSLDSILDSAELRQIATESDQLEELERARRLLDCARSEASVQYPITVPGLGDFTLHLLVGEKLPREVHVLRNGIYITDNFAKFAEPMRRFPGTREFTAVLEPARSEAGRKPSSLLKKLENPSHDAFEPERIVDPKALQDARDQIRYLIKRVRKIIKSVAKIDDINRSQLDELSHLFADRTNGDGDGEQDAEKDPERFRYGVARKDQRNPPPGTSGEGSGKRRFGKDIGKTMPETKKNGVRSPHRGTGTRPAMPLEAIRSFLPEPKDARKRTVYFTPGADGDIELTVAASGLSGDVALAVAKCSKGVATHGRIKANVKAGQRVVLDLTFTEPFAGPIELSARALDNETSQEPV